MPKMRGIFDRFYGLFFGVFIIYVEGENADIMELKMANVLYRHGDRSPIHSFPSDMHKGFWKQGLGQLTQLGMKQEFEMGRFLKGRYVPTLLNGTYLRKQVHCRSSDKDRTIMSAEAQMAGLYPPKYKNISFDKEWEFWQLIPIHTVPKSYDALLRPFDGNCPRYKEILNKSYSEKKYVKVKQEYKEFVKNISKLVNAKSLTMETVYRVYDMFFCQRAHNLSQPKWLTPEVWQKLKFLHAFGFSWLFNSPEKSKLTGGLLLGEMIQNMKNFALNPKQSKKLYVYSAHDTTVVALLSALKLYSGIPPPYSTTFLMELYQNTNSKEYQVRMFYRNDTRRPYTPYEYHLPDCKPTECTLKKFISQTAAAVPVDYEKECHAKRFQSEKECKDHLRKSKSCKDMLTAMVIIVLLVFLSVVGYLVRQCQKRRKASSLSQFRQVQVEEWDSD